MENSSLSAEERKAILAEEMIKYVLLKDFGIYWEPESQETLSPKQVLSEFYTSCVLLGEAVTSAWRKFHAAIDDESLRVFNSLDSSAEVETIYASLKEVAKKIDLPNEFIFFIVMAIFGDLCVRISRSGAESLISKATLAAKKYIVDEDLARVKDLQMNSIIFMEFCDDDKDNNESEKQNDNDNNNSTEKQKDNNSVNDKQKDNNIVNDKHNDKNNDNP